nr:uncharacterized protein CI109_000661 [Kwoniella shandongensis]KAA5531089.1 hypothetical protein CI109_000661 [Kwoniella shandongensis]
MPGRLGIDLSAVSVLSYLESYPYPSFALLIPVPPSNLTSSYGGAASSGSAGSLEDLPFTRGQTTPIKAFDIVWSNSRWKTLVKDRPLLDCLDVQGARALGDWLSGAKELRARNRRISSSTASQTTSDKEELAGAAPEGFWESEIGYEDHSPSKRVDNVIPEGEDERVVEEANEMLPTLTLDLVGPIKVTLELTKTAISPNEYLRGGLISTATTHTLVVITSTIRSAINIIPPSVPLQPTARVLPSLQVSGGTTDHSESDSSTSVATTIKPKFEPKTTILSEPSSTPSTLSRPTLAASILDPEMAKNGTAAAIDFDYSTITPQPDRPLFFNRDGTVTRPKPRTERTDPKGKSSDIHVLFETTDWSKTPLGPRESWPPSLKTIVSVLLAYPSPLCIWWGPELTLLYNQPFSASVEKHPDVFGVSGAVAWAEIWDQLGPLSELVMSGTTMWREDEFFLLKNKNSQGGQLYECYHTWSWLPIRQEDGTVGGLWNSNVDSTKKVLVDRRLATTREIGEQSAIARTTREFHSAVIDVLGANPRDIPFAAMYQVTVPTETGKGESHPPATIKVNLTRTGSVGVPEDDPSSPSHLAFSLRPAPRSVGSNDSTNPRPRSPTLSVASSLSVPSMSPLAFQDDQQLPGCTQWPFREALQTRRMVLVENCAELVKNFPIREWDELPNAAVVIPIANDSDQGVPPAVLTVGLNVRRPFDDDYENFLLASGIAAARSYEAEKQRIDDLAALDRAKSLLFSNISHELRTPLTLIAGPLDDLLQVNQDPRQKEWLTLARSNTRLEAGKLKGSFRAVNLGIVTRDLAGQFAAAFQKAKLEYVVDCDTSPHTTYVDIEQWEKIVFNLLGNAMKYTLHGTVIVSFTYSDTQAVLAVKDTGVGIPASDINLIGERFHRVASTSRSHEGTGIGLALVKELVKLHGGALEVESATAAEGANGAHGSTFRVRIPLGSEHLPSDALDHDDSTLTRTVNIASYGRDIINEATLWNKNIESSGDSASDDSSPLGTSVESITMSNIRGAEQSLLYFEKTDIVLIVDDSFDTRKYLSSMFAPYCVVVEARDGQEALDKCMQIRPDLIITDVMMPVLDGFGLLRALKQSDELKAIPVIMVTAHDGDEAKVEALLGGADDYMVKPFNVRELIARAHVQLLLGKKRRQLEMAFKEQTLELRAVSEYSPGGIFRASDQGVIGFANDAW